ncbi:hypothetical protein BJ741DRAFT_618156 [Chytriomyces cf. hyalinus JEL632]|nr:hypothetical protein BJ741DRAFT_618156 [Chytriomyces cf. hyalinus JEL632]
MLYLQLACVYLAAMSHAMPAGLVQRESNEAAPTRSSENVPSGEPIPLNTLGGSEEKSKAMEGMGANEAEPKKNEAESKVNEAESKKNEAESKVNEAESKKNEAESKTNEAEPKKNEAEPARKSETNAETSPIKNEEQSRANEGTPRASEEAGRPKDESNRTVQESGPIRQESNTKNEGSINRSSTEQSRTQESNRNSEESINRSNEESRSQESNRNSGISVINESGQSEESELSNLEYVNGFQFGGRMVLDSNFIGELSSSFPGMNYVSVGNIISDLTRLRMRSNLMEGCRRISQQRRVRLIIIVRIANSCLRRMQLRRVRINSSPMIIFRTIGNGMIRPRMVRSQSQRVIRIIIVQRVQTRIQNVCRTLRISPQIGTRCVQRILVNMGSWGCCGQRGNSIGSIGSIGSNRQSGSRQSGSIIINGRDGADIDVNSTEMQSMALDMIEGLEKSITKLSNMTEDAAMEWSTGFAAEMKVPQEMVSNIASELISSMMEDNASTGEAFDALSNVALAKKEVMAEPMSAEMMSAAEEIPSMTEMAAEEKKQLPTKAPAEEKKAAEEVKPVMAAETKPEEKKASEEAKPEEKSAETSTDKSSGVNRNAVAAAASAATSTTMSMGMSMNMGAMETGTMMMAMKANLKSGSVQVAASVGAALAAFMLF